MKTTKNDQLKFFEHRPNPFRDPPNVQVFFPHQCHQDAYSNIVDGVRKRAGLLILTGVEGIGKTTVVKKAVHELANETCRVLFHRGETRFLELVNYFCRVLNVIAKNRSETNTQALSRFLTEQYRQGVNLVMVLDDLRGVDQETILELRALSMPLGATENMLQVILVGPPRIEQMLPPLCDPSIPLRYKLTELADHEVAPYLNYYLNLPNSDRASPLSKEAVDRIAFLPNGIPGKINLICDASLLIAEIEGCQSISSDMVDKAARIHSPFPTGVGVSSLIPSEDSHDRRHNAASPFQDRTSRIDRVPDIEDCIASVEPLMLDADEKDDLTPSRLKRNFLENLRRRVERFVRQKKFLDESHDLADSLVRFGYDYKHCRVFPIRRCLGSRHRSRRICSRSSVFSQYTSSGISRD